LGACGTSGPHKRSVSETKWTWFQPKGGGFSILMPGHPKGTITDQPTTNAPTVKVHQFIVDPDSSTEFGVLYNDIPEGLPYIHLVGTKWFFDTVQQEVVQKFDGRLIFSKDIHFGDYPAREIKFEVADKGWSYNTRWIVVRHRQFQLIVVSQLGTDVSKDVEAFFNSFIVHF
jgi:hypothetical protein